MPASSGQAGTVRSAYRVVVSVVISIALTEDPTKGNPLRVKGGGEAGITPALAVVMNAVMDALKDYGIEHIDMPATPHRIWSAIQAAKRASCRHQGRLLSRP